MSIRLGVVMDPIGSINYEKDSTLAMLWAAQARGWKIYYFEQNDLFLCDGIPYGDARLMSVAHDSNKSVELQNPQTIKLADLDLILMRKDPPFNEKYIYTTYLLEHAERLGVLVVNRPQGLRDANEKLFATAFPQCTPPTLVTQSVARLHAFWREHKDIVCKPLDKMGGDCVYRLQAGDVNANVIFASLTEHETNYIMAQKFLPEIKNGDKRILIINGEPFSHALTRVPQGSDWRGNLAVGAKGVVQPLSKRDLWLAEQVGPKLLQHGLYFVGLDVIGDYITEINVTSPTGIREIDAALGCDIAALLLDAIEKL